MNVRLYLLQRATALLMVPLVLGHLGIIFYATRNGLSAADVFSRTKGSLAWAAFYMAFVLAVSVHGAIGVRAVAHEWAKLHGRSLDLLMWCVGIVLVVLGLRAVAAVVL
jgi:succinate dehydrogenase subunit C